MPRPAQPPRLYLRERKGREARYVILDRGREIGTGFGESDQRGAEEAFGRYLADKHRPDFGDGHPSKVAVADALTYYLESLRDDHSGPEPYHVDRLLEGLGDLTCDAINIEACRKYVKARTGGAHGRRPVVEATARRELETLAAALNLLHRHGKLDRPIPIAKPDAGQPNERWLTRMEAARLLRGALGYEAVGVDDQGGVKGWRRVAEPNYHVARFILIALYTATRHSAVLALRWTRNPTAGSVDLVTETIHRRGTAERETRKRRPPCPIPHRLMPHLRRWRRLTIHGPCEYDGEIIQRQRSGFESAKERAGLGADVTPHTLKHTCITWLLQKGVPTWQVAGFTGTSEGLITRVYGHHSPNYMEEARSAIGRR